MKALAFAALAAALIPTLVQAQAARPAAAAASDTAFAERSQVIAAGRNVMLYGLPTTDSTGAFKYYDVTLTMQVNDKGVPTSSAAVVSVKSPTPRTSLFVEGSYVGSNGETCNLVTSSFAGRIEVDLRCTAGSYSSSFTWYTGPIIGNPLQTRLVAAGLDQLIDNDQYAWGDMASRNNGAIWFGCFVPPNLISARQVGGNLSLTNYVSGNTAICQTELTKTNP